KNPLYLRDVFLYCVIKETITMMSEMDANRPAYGAYEGQQRPIPPYEGYQQPPLGGVIDDNFIEAVSQRVAQQMAQQSQQSGGKVYNQRRSSMLPAGLRGAIAIVSVAAFIPLGIVLGGLGNLVALAIVGVVLLGINAITNGLISPRD